MEEVQNDSEGGNLMQELESLKAEAKKAAQEALELDARGEDKSEKADQVYELNKKIWALQAKLGIKEE